MATQMASPIASFIRHKDVFKMTYEEAVRRGDDGAGRRRCTLMWNRASTNVDWTLPAHRRVCGGLAVHVDAHAWIRWTDTCSQHDVIIMIAGAGMVGTEYPTRW